MTTNTEFENNEPEQFEKLVAPQASRREHEFKYISILVFGYAHIAALYGLYLGFEKTKWLTIALGMLLSYMSIFGITAGCHRLWAHRSYKAKLPLQIFLMLCSSVAGQYSAIHWVRDHRMHHKYSDTDADPHNATRGVFFSHIGWLLVAKHPELKKRGKGIYMTDVYKNPVLRFQKRYIVQLISLLCLILPTVVPMYFWGETLNSAWHTTLLRYILNLHTAFLINSVGHTWGHKPYDKNIAPTQNVALTLITCGEGFHNYHHAFPSDYRTGELGNNTLNLTTKIIDFFAWIGWAYDLNSTPSNVIERKAQRTGDGTNLWGKIVKNLST